MKNHYFMYLSLNASLGTNPFINLLCYSGLDHNNFLGPSDVPRVSQYRLAAHLSSAVILFSVLFWNAKVGSISCIIKSQGMPFNLEGGGGDLAHLSRSGLLALS